MTEWMNNETGEVLSYEEAWTQFIADYDGDDTNILGFLAMFEPLNLPIVL